MPIFFYSWELFLSLVIFAMYCAIISTIRHRFSSINSEAQTTDTRYGRYRMSMLENIKRERSIHISWHFTNDFGRCVLPTAFFLTNKRARKYLRSRLRNSVANTTHFQKMNTLIFWVLRCHFFVWHSNVCDILRICIEAVLNKQATETHSMLGIQYAKKTYKKFHPLSSSAVLLRTLIYLLIDMNDYGGTEIVTLNGLDNQQRNKQMTCLNDGKAEFSSNK
ncbi:unnamed protein product [Wuchereria bancrofti]|uniref:Uncharacterized protein n=1 Tax=Wuchereria bancrofti TaxID=6293 RepID=A0A3P7FNC8_WUCBA|nr:unnamed protein product [Wuchereria bancrofti]